MDQPVLRTTHLADAADELGLPSIGAGGMVFLGPPGRAVMGRAFTVQQRAVDLAPGAPAPATRHGEAAASLAAPGDILVIAVEGETAAATWGEAHTLRALRRGLAGVVIDGFTRDAEAVRGRGLPALVRGASPLRSLGRMETVSVGEGVHAAGVIVRAGDLVAIDGDGFVCVPAAQVEAVLARAAAIAAREDQRDRALQTGLHCVPKTSR
jgi:regulator of RNase E activity RraA